MHSKTLVNISAAVTLGFAQPAINGSEPFHNANITPITPTTPALVEATLTTTKTEEAPVETLDTALLKNTEEFVVRSGDSPIGLALKHDLGLEEFIALNERLGTRWFIWEGRKIVIYPGQIYRVPKDLEQFRADNKRIKLANASAAIYAKLQSGASIAQIRQNSKPVFPSTPGCLGLPEVLDSFLHMQEGEYNPKLPVIVDPRNEMHASCANLIRQTFIQACNLDLYTPEQKKMLLTPDLDAWILVREIRDKFGYTQSFADLMQAFDMKSFHNRDPITNPEKRLDYQARIRELHTYLKTAPAGTIVPMYFGGSQSKSKVLAHLNPKDPHLNTHQTMLAGNIDWEILASEIPKIERGVRVDFGHDADRIAKELPLLRTSAEMITKQLEIDTQKIRDLLNVKKDPESLPFYTAVQSLAMRAFLDPKFEILLKRATPEGFNIPKELFIEGKLNRGLFMAHTSKELATKIQSGSLDMSGLRRLFPWHSFAQWDVSILEKRLVLISSVVRMRNTLSAAPITKELLQGKEFSMLTQQSSALAVLRKGVMAELSALETNQKRLKKLESMQKSPNDQTRTALDTLIDFIADRADFPSSFLPAFRATVLRWIETYPELVEIYANGTLIDFKKELDSRKKGGSELLLRPTDTLRITGPALLDGEMKPTSENPEEQKRMNARIRIFWEFALTIYLPTEALTPGKNTLPGRQQSEGPQALLKQTRSYSLRTGDRLETVLKSRITQHEGLSIYSPNDQRKIFEHYTWQIRWLQLDGFLQSEAEFNPGAMNENRIIPYYDIASVKVAWGKFVTQMREKNINFEKVANGQFIEIFTLGWAGLDSKRRIFQTLLETIEASEARLRQFPVLRNIRKFNEFQYEAFMEMVFAASIHDIEATDARDFYSNIRPGKTLYIGNHELARIAQKITQIIPIAAANIKPLDSALISHITPSPRADRLITHILVNESYPTENWTGLRTFSKKFLWKSKWDFQIRFEEVMRNQLIISKGTLMIVAPEGLIPVNWPKKQHIEEALISATSQEVINIWKQHLSPSAQQTFAREITEARRLLSELQKTELGAEATTQTLKKIFGMLRIDSWDGSNLVGKSMGAVFQKRKLADHYEKSAYWLDLMKEDFSEVAEDPDLAKRYEYSVAFINNQSENRALLAFTQNYTLRIFESLGIDVPTRDVFAKPKNILKKMYQAVTQQIYYEREVFMSHMESYQELLRSRITTYRLGVTYGAPGFTVEHLGALEMFSQKIDGYMRELQTGKDTNKVLLAILSDDDLRNTLKQRGVETHFLPTEKEFVETKHPFRNSIFGYVRKISDRLQSEEQMPEEKVKSGFLSSISKLWWFSEPRDSSKKSQS
jgi:hypothetical protein